jgi:hypothetical protein
MWPGVTNYQVDVLPDDADGQIAGTIGIMTRYVREDRHSQEVVDLGRRIVTPGSERGIVEGVWGWVHGRLGFLHDETLAATALAGISADYGGAEIVETLVRPRDMAEACGRGECRGDCDDYAMLAAALIEAWGIPTSFVTVAADARDPSRYSHVYVAAYPRVGGGNGGGERERIVVDASHGDYAGWEAENKYGKLREWAMDVPTMAEVIGLVLAFAAVVAAWWMGEALFGDDEDGGGYEDDGRVSRVPRGRRR